MLKEAKEELKEIIISEKGEVYYQQEIQKRIKLFGEIKESGDLVFGRDTEQFRKNVIQSVLEKYENEDEETQLYETVMADIALDIFNK